MARPKSPADLLFENALRVAVVPILKSAEFRKTGTSFHRRHGETVQVVNFQLSQGNTSDEKRFYVNVGIAFDAICELRGIPILERVKEHECDDRGTRDRIEALVPCPDEDWVLRADSQAPAMLEDLRGCMFALESELTCIEGLATYRMHRWFDRFRPKQENAQILYLLGEFGEARAEVEALAALIADRQNANDPAWWVERLKLLKLKV